eukprot:4126307-Alexandrium_andersonii.AAC.1
MFVSLYGVNVFTSLPLDPVEGTVQMSQLLKCFHRAFREHARGFRTSQAEAFASGDSLPRLTKF